ncbi:hypothetical protein LZ32DRAFT_387825 [Colletotrichum eremochloae]|nr:hypothetical protein LZ32DRAFT_387825 [Colletotrichum eremochloae]
MVRDMSAGTKWSLSRSTFRSPWTAFASNKHCRCSLPPRINCEFDPAHSSFAHSLAPETGCQEWLSAAEVAAGDRVIVTALHPGKPALSSNLQTGWQLANVTLRKGAVLRRPPPLDGRKWQLELRILVYKLKFRFGKVALAKTSSCCTRGAMWELRPVFRELVARSGLLPPIGSADIRKSWAVDGYERTSACRSRPSSGCILFWSPRSACCPNS